MPNIIHTYAPIPGLAAVLEWEGPAIEDLGEVDGRRYVSVAEESLASLKLAEGLSFRQATVEEVAVLKRHSPVIRQIDLETAATIRTRYAIEDEFKAIRTEDADYLSFVETTVVQGKARKAALGF